VELVLALVIVAALAWVVTAPLRRDRGANGATQTEDPRVAELEARKEALYRQIRDAELDRAQGKLSEPDWRRADAELRREAIEVLKELDRTRSAVEAPGA
jgi:type II secretory pathway component PulJ